MEKTILVIRKAQYGNCKPNYHTEKSAKTLEEAMRYKVALELLNNEKEITYLLFNEVGQFDVERIQKIVNEDEVADANK